MGHYVYYKVHETIDSSAVYIDVRNYVWRTHFSCNSLVCYVQ